MCVSVIIVIGMGLIKYNMRKEINLKIHPEHPTKQNLKTIEKDGIRFSVEQSLSEFENNPKKKE